jgi:hypothetical protein
MTNETAKKRRPDYLAYAVIPGNETSFVRVGVGFTLKNDGVSVLTDALALSGHLILVDIDGEVPSLNGFSHSDGTSAPHFTASMVRDGGKESYWTEIGHAHRRDGYISISAAVLPISGKIILTVPKQ